MTAIAACIIVYRADAEGLKRLITTIYDSDISLSAIWSNTALAPEIMALAAQSKVHLIGTKENLGVARALNGFAQWAHAHGAKWAIAFDEDSQIDAKNLSALISEFRNLKAAEVEASTSPLAAMGPQLIDARSQQPMPQFSPYGLIRKRLLPSHIADHLITSAMLFDLQAYHAIGPFNEPYFIDLVDIEWCLRARAQGFGLRVAQGAFLKQRIGLKTHTIFGRSLYVHQPERNYFMVRNALWLIRFAPIRCSRRINEAMHLVLRIAHILIFGDGRANRMRTIGRGVRSGLLESAKSDRQTQI